MSVTGAIMAGVGAAGSIGGAAIASSGANKAAETQVQGADYAASLQKQAADAALAEQQRQFNTTQQNLSPWLSTGQSGLANLSYLSGLMSPGGATSGTAMGPTATNFGGATSSGLNAPIISGTADNGLGGGRGVLADGTPISPSGTVKDPTTGGSTTAGVPQGVNYSAQPLSSLVNPALGAPGSLLQPFTEQFKPPDASTLKLDPGYQFRMDQAMQNIQQSAAARGGLLTGGTAKALTDYSSGAASQEYNNAYNRAYNEYSTRYNAFENNQNTAFNRLAAISGVGQTTASQLGQFGLQSATNIGNIEQNSATQIGNQANNAAAARASGYAASANAFGGALGNSTNGLMNLYLMNQLFAPGTDIPAGQLLSQPSPGALTPGICWIAAELYGGWSNPRTQLVRSWLLNVYEKTPIGRVLVGLYRRFGQRIAERMKRSSLLRAVMRPLFDLALSKAVKHE